MASAPMAKLDSVAAANQASPEICARMLIRAPPVQMVTHARTAATRRAQRALVDVIAPTDFREATALSKLRK